MKKALVIDTLQFCKEFKDVKDIPLDFTVIQKGIPSIYNLESKIVNRYFEDGSPDCEQNPNYLQILPYITLYRLSEKGEVQYFMYTRGELSTESRLTGKCSLGLGGHIEEMGDTLRESMFMGARRELMEEVGLQNIEEITLIGAFADGNFLFINNHKVESYHLGLSIFLNVTDQIIESKEKGIITKGKWVTRQEITKLTESGEIELELWSKIVFENSY